MKTRSIIVLTLSFLSVFSFSCQERKIKSEITNVSKKSDVIDVSRFKFNDSTLPLLKSGFYLISKSDSGNLISKKFYDFSKQKVADSNRIFSLSISDFVSFENIDSIYLEKSNSEYEDFFNIVLILNQTGQNQLSYLTAKTKALTEDEQYDGLVVGTVINNTLIQISHIHQQIDTNVISIAGGNFYEETVKDIKKYLEKGKNEN